MPIPDAVLKSVLGDQYGATLRMFRTCLERADSGAWLAPVGKFPFWHIAYHTLYFTDLYLSPNEKAFTPPAFHREGYNFFGYQPWMPEKLKSIVVDQPYEKEAMLGYCDACRAKAKQAIAAETDATLAGASGFQWLQFPRLEAHLYNIRHIQHHAGQLGATLRRHGVEGAQWVPAEAV